MTAKEERRARLAASKELAALPIYTDGLPLNQIDAILQRHGFNGLEPAIYCGRDGESHEQVGERTWLKLTWHKMDVSGRYEIVAYLS